MDNFLLPFPGLFVEQVLDAAIQTPQSAAYIPWMENLLKLCHFNAVLSNVLVLQRVGKGFQILIEPCFVNLVCRPVQLPIHEVREQLMG